MFSTGACWAIAAVSSILGALAADRNSKVNKQLSVQQVLDCSLPDGDDGCQGAMPGDAFEFILRNGLSLHTVYEKNPSCDAQAAVKLLGYEHVPADLLVCV